MAFHAWKFANKLGTSLVTIVTDKITVDTRIKSATFITNNVPDTDRLRNLK